MSRRLYQLYLNGRRALCTADWIVSVQHVVLILELLEDGAPDEALG